MRNTVQRMVKLRIQNSIATLEAYKRESGKKTNCYKYERNTTEMLLE